MTDSAPAQPADDGNARPYSVSELAFALKRTLEDGYGYVRLRGELSKVTNHSNGHVYLSIKDDKACIDGVVWKGSVRGLNVRPEQGLEVIVTGRITTYPQGSRYQIVIESMEAAGVGALLAQLERLKAKLQAEGLFDPAAKRPIPSMPAVIGVITSPTGAVIRDILHRIRDRWPCRVVVWPVVVQGDAAAAQVCNAIMGFNRLTVDGAVPRPDVIIVARGGGSVEDLWAFNDEGLARTVAAGTIPLISAVGHETDTTLIDFVSDRRAPTPTAAAEMATPVLGELRAAIADHQRRLARSGARMIEDRRAGLLAAARGLPRPADLLGMAGQRLAGTSGRLAFALRRNVAVHERELARTAGQFKPSLLDRPREVQARRLGEVNLWLNRAAARSVVNSRQELVRVGDRLAPGLARNVLIHETALKALAARLRTDLFQRPSVQQADRLREVGGRLQRAASRRLDDAVTRLKALEQLRLSNNPDRPLARGFARVTRADGSLVRAAATLSPGEAVALRFADGTVAATVEGEGAPREAPAAASSRPPARPRSRPAPAPGQGDLF